MTMLERIVVALVRIQDYIPLLYVLLFLTALWVIVLSLMSRGLWLDRPAIRFVALFFELDTRGMVCLASSWCKLVLFILLVVNFQLYDLSYYLFLLVIGLPYCLFGGGFLRIFGRCFWMSLQMLGLLSTNILCGYIQQVRNTIPYMILYILLSGFFILFGIYLFLTELNDISTERRVNIEALERKARQQRENT